MLRICLLSGFAVMVAGHDNHGGSGGLDAEIACPGSPASNHAWLTAEITASASCADVKAEIEARVDGQATGAWRDPHDGGSGKQKYTMLEGAAAGRVLLSRLSSNGAFTDKQLFTFHELDANKCKITGCSESQGMSMGDQSTNWCNLHNLYCGNEDRCCVMKTDVTYVVDRVQKSSMAGSDSAVCLGGSGGSGSGMGGEEQTTCGTVETPDEGGTTVPAEDHDAATDAHAATTTDTHADHDGRDDHAATTVAPAVDPTDVSNAAARFPLMLACVVLTGACV